MESCLKRSRMAVNFAQLSFSHSQYDVSHFPNHAPVGLVTAVSKSGNKSDMRNYRGITEGSVIAKLFAMMLDHTIAVWAEEEGVKAKSQAGFRTMCSTTDNLFVSNSLIDKQKQTRQGKRPEGCVILLTSRRHLIQFLIACCGRCLSTQAYVNQSLTA